MRLKTVDDLTRRDFEGWPVWEFTDAHEEEIDEAVVRPVLKLPVTDLGSRLVGTQVTLANGRKRWAIISNIYPGDRRSTQHFLLMQIFNRGRLFPLVRYHDVAQKRFGPAALAAFLRLPIDAVFPISYDLRPYCVGDPSILVGKVDRRPKERLTDKQLVRLAVRGTGEAESQSGDERESP